MAQKRSYVGAILNATNSSGRFTQDGEDMDLGNKGSASAPQTPPVQQKSSHFDSFNRELDNMPDPVKTRGTAPILPSKALIPAQTLCNRIEMAAAAHDISKLEDIRQEFSASSEKYSDADRDQIREALQKARKHLTQGGANA
jgi:hypothetical protein